MRTSKVTTRCSLMGVSASVLAVMNSKHLHYSRKPVRLKDGEEGREGGRERVSAALKLAARDLTCNKAWSNKTPRLPASPSSCQQISPGCPNTIRPCFYTEPSHMDKHMLAKSAFFSLLDCSGTNMWRQMRRKKTANSGLRGLYQ